MQYRKPFVRALFFVFLLVCLLSGLTGVVRVPANAAPQFQGPLPSLEIVINELAWSGTIQSPFDEWIELYNPPDTPPGSDVVLDGWRIESINGSLSIDLAGASVPEGGYLLLERASPNVVKDVNGFVYLGSSGLLSDTGETLYLLDDGSNVVDIVNSANGDWPGGNFSPKGSMERYAPLQDSNTIWATNDGSVISNGIDNADNPINGTPGAENWAYSFPPPTNITITSHTPEPSTVNGNVTVSVSVTGGYVIPTGTVSITGANTNCTINLSANGTGQCVVVFASTGDKTITATYNGDSEHPTATTNVGHKVRPSSTTTIISDNPDPSVSNQTINIVVLVSGSGSIPTGTVSVTGASTNCTITLSGGSGDCDVKFSSSGSFTLAANYSGDNNYAASSDNEPHQVIPPTPIPTRTPFVFRTSTPRPQPPPPLLGINEFVPRPGHDWNNDGVIDVGDEYIELINHGVVDISLGGYRLDDEANIGSSPYTLPSGTLRPGERIVYYGSQTGLLLSDGGDGVRLLKSNGQLADAYNYFVVEFPDQTFCRLPDNGGLDDWNTNCYPTPGLQNALNGSILRPPTQGDDNEPLCPIADTLPQEFVLAECAGFGNNIWSRYYWDRFGWYGGMSLPNVNGKWDAFAE